MTYTFRTSELPELDSISTGTDSKHGTSNGSPTAQALQLGFSHETLNIVDNLGLTKVQKKDQAQTIAALKQYVDG